MTLKNVGTVFREKKENSCLEILIATNMCTKISMNFLEKNLLYYISLLLYTIYYSIRTVETYVEGMVASEIYKTRLLRRSY